MGTVATKSSSNNKRTSKGKMNEVKSGYIRRASHAGSWYSENKNELHAQLTKMMQAAVPVTSPNALSQQNHPLKAVICPHAGFSYSGSTAAYSFQNVQNELEQNPAITSIVVLHPSHHVYLDGCALSGASQLETPLGNLQVDDNIREELLATKQFTIMDQEVDEDEHSGEMQYPFLSLAATNANAKVKVLPIMVGSISAKSEAHFGQLLAPILSRFNILTVISSDFMHWGQRFGYQPTVQCKQIHEHISDLDRRGMNLIQGQDPQAFLLYLKETKNTICGRHPISVWLQAVQTNSSLDVERLDITFVKYAQSSKVMSLRESSVSYASAIALRVS